MSQACVHLTDEQIDRCICYFMMENRLRARVPVLLDGRALIQDARSTADFVRHPSGRSFVEVNLTGWI